MKIKYDIIFGMGFDFIAILVVFVIILFSMVLHEMAHAYTAFFLGDTTAKEEGRLSVNPLKHIDPFLSIMIPLLLFISLIYKTKIGLSFRPIIDLIC